MTSDVSVYDAIRTLVDVNSDFRPSRVILAGTRGAVVECYREPEGYAVDLAIPDDSLVGGFDYENVILTREQFEITEKYTGHTPAAGTGTG